MRLPGSVRTISLAIVLAVAGATATTSARAEMIPTGPADANEETSRGVTRILDACVAAYEDVETMHARGRYLAISKTEDTGTSFVEAQVSLDYIRPHQLSIRSVSPSDSIDCYFVADGTSVTMIDSSTGTYAVIPQPDSLAAFSDDYREGEIYSEPSGAMGISTIGPLLMSDNVRDILYEGIQRYIYEGIETIGDWECHRVRFIQTSPDIGVILWIDQKSSLIRKTSFIYSYDANYNRVESFEEGVTAAMMIMEWETMTLDRDDVDQAKFTIDVPEDYTSLLEDTTATETSSDSGMGFWESLIASAAATSQEETTWSLTRLAGELDFQISGFIETDETIVEFISTAIADHPSPLLAVGLESGRIAFHDAAGTARTTTTLPIHFTTMSILETPTSRPLILVEQENTKTMEAYDMNGIRQWTYRHPFSGITRVSTGDVDEPFIYMALESEGLRKLDQYGNVLAASSEQSSVRTIRSVESGTDLVLARGFYEIGMYTKNLKRIKIIETDEPVPSMIWDTRNPVSPIIDVALSSDADVLLERRNELGDVEWTIMVAPKVDDVSGSGLAWINLPVHGEIQRCIIVVLSNGVIVVASVDGNVLYRGKVDANNALVRRNDDDVLANLCITDLNGDGIDEVYSRMDKHLVKITTGK